MKGLSFALIAALVIVLTTIKDIEGKKMNIEEAKKTIKNLRKVCMKKTDVSKELVDGTHKGEFPQDEQLMCYLKCILSSTKTLKNDEIQWDFFVKNSRLMLLDEYVPRVEHAVEVCKQQVTATEGCIIAWQFGKCVFETDAELYIAP